MAASTASAHLSRLVEGGLLRVLPQGRHRYYELASPQVAAALEALARLAPVRPVRSLRAGTRARTLRLARTCYDHVAGHLGVAIMRSLLERDALVGTDGLHHPGRAKQDRLSTPGQDHDYQLTDTGWELFAHLGVAIPESRRRRLVGYCVDWTEQLYFQQVRHYSPLLAGLALLPQPGIASLASWLGGRHTARRGARPVMLIGLTVGSLGLLAMTLSGTHSPYWVLVVPLLAIGFGNAYTMPAATAATIEAAPSGQVGIASGALNSSRQVGSTLGVAVFGTLVATTGAFMTGYHLSVLIGGLVFAAGGLIALLVIPATTRTPRSSSPMPRLSPRNSW